MPVSTRSPGISNRGLTKAYGPASSGPGTAASAKKKPAWNDRPADDDKYKLSKEEVLRRKKLYVSKHNAFATYDPVDAVREGRKKAATRAAKKTKGAPQNTKTQSFSNIGRMKDPLLEMTSLDYLAQSSEEDEDEEDALSVGSVEGDSDVENYNNGEQSNLDETPDLDETVDLTKFLNSKKTQRHASSLGKRDAADGRNHNCSWSRSSPIKRPTVKVSSNRKKEEFPPTKKAVSLNEAADTPISADMLDMLRALYGELVYYEELSGRRSVFDFTVCLLPLRLLINIPWFILTCFQILIF